MHLRIHFFYRQESYHLQELKSCLDQRKFGMHKDVDIVGNNNMSEMILVMEIFQLLRSGD